MSTKKEESLMQKQDREWVEFLSRQIGQMNPTPMAKDAKRQIILIHESQGKGVNILLNGLLDAVPKHDEKTMSLILPLTQANTMSPLFSIPPEIRFEIFAWVHTETELTENPQEHLLTCRQHYVENRLLTFALNWQEGYLHRLPELDNFVARLVPGQMEAIQYLTLSFDCETGLASGIEVEKLALLTGLRHLHVKILAWFCQCPEHSKDDHHLEAAVKEVDERILAKSYPKNEDKGSGRSNYKLIGGGIVTFHLCDSHEAFLSEQSTLS